jgi:hypothetical protein
VILRAGSGGRWGFPGSARVRIRVPGGYSWRSPTRSRPSLLLPQYKASRGGPACGLSSLRSRPGFPARSPWRIRCRRISRRRVLRALSCARFPSFHGGGRLESPEAVRDNQAVIAAWPRGGGSPEDGGAGEGSCFVIASVSRALLISRHSGSLSFWDRRYRLCCF